MIFTPQSETGRLRKLLLKHPREAFCDQQTIDREWQLLRYTAPPDFERALEEYDRFVALLRQFDIEIYFLPASDTTTLDSIYVRDAAVFCDKGAILCNTGKAARGSEPAEQERFFREMGIPIHGHIAGDGRLEGGDVVWLDEDTLAVGRSYRTNAEGILQLRELVAGCAETVIEVPLPHWRGPDDVFHLMSILSPIDRNLALVYSPLLPIPFRDYLLSRGMRLIEVPDSEFASMACNVLAVAPRTCIMLAGNPQTQERLEREGVEVHVFRGNEICHKGAGGPTCLTRPMVRREEK